MYMGGEMRVGDVGKRLMAILGESRSDQQPDQTIAPSPLYTSTIDFETAAIDVLTLLDLNLRQPAMSMAEAVLLAAEAGRTLLHLSASLGLVHLLRVLLECGVDPNQRDDNGFTALHFAAFYGHINCVRLLARQGAAFAILDAEGRSAKQVASESNHYDVAEFLGGDESVTVRKPNPPVQPTVGPDSLDGLDFPSWEDSQPK